MWKDTPVNKKKKNPRLCSCKRYILNRRCSKIYGKRIYHANTNQKKASAILLICDNVDLRTKDDITKYKEKHCIIIAKADSVYRKGRKSERSKTIHVHLLTSLYKTYSNAQKKLRACLQS